MGQRGGLGFQFQSLVGFKINWNSVSSTDCINSLRFQSLVGFKINWNLGM